MRICFISDTVFTLGGIQRVISVLSSELVKYHDIDILCTNDKFKINRQLYDLSEKVNINIEKNLLKRNFIIKAWFKILKIINMKTGIFNNSRFECILKEIYYPKSIQNKFIKYLESKDYDVVIGVAGYYSILLGVIKDKLNCKTIGWQHNSYDAYLNNKGRYHWNQNILFKRYLSRLDKYIVLAKYDKKKFWQEMNIESDVIYNPKSFSSEIKSDVSKKQFLAAGRFIYQKGFDLLIESFYEFSKKNKDWNLVIVGEGEEKEEIFKKIDEYKLNDRIFVENFTDNIKKYFLESSSLLLSSRWEGMPMIVLESLEMGVPVISYDITAIESLIDNKKEGLIIEKFETKKFAQAMYEISNSYEMRYELSRNAITKSNQFEVSNIVKEWNKIVCE